MQYHVIRAEDSAIVGSGETQDFAYNLAMRLQAETGKKHYAKRAPDTNWRERENQRFISGEYQEVPWSNELWWLERSEETRFHFAHVSKEKESMVAFTESEEKGEQDRQTRIRAGVYLTRFFGNVLTVKEIQEWTRIFQGEKGDSPSFFQLARTPDEIEEVYTNGPASCMSSGDFDGDEHPARVYGDSDLAIAYIRKPSEYHDEPIASRALVWPEKKIYGRIYPTPERYDSGARRESAFREQERLLRALKAEGYSQGSFDGALIRCIEGPRDDSYIMPYLDGGYRITHVRKDGENYFRMGERGDLCASETCGVIYTRGRYVCERCEDSMDEDDSYCVYVSRHSTESWCCGCYENNTFYCNGYGENFSEDMDSVEGPDGNIYSLYYAESHFSFCERDEVWCDSSEMQDVYTSEENTESWCEHARDNFAFYCSGTHCYYESSQFESVEIDGETYWKDHAEGDLILSAKLREMRGEDDTEEESESLESTEG